MQPTVFDLAQFDLVLDVFKDIEQDLGKFVFVTLDNDIAPVFELDLYLVVFKGGIDSIREKGFIVLSGRR